MAAKDSSVPKCDDEEQALKGLLDAFSSTFSLEERPSAYCKAGRKADLAAEVLFDMQGSTSTFDTSLSYAEATGAKSTKSSCGNFSEKIVQANGNSRPSKTKGRPLSGGTVSSILGKDYIRSVPSTNGSCKVDKPIKKVWRFASMSELSEVEAESSSLKDDIMHQDMEDFLFKTLGDEFKLDRGVIQQVLDNCGYDMQKSMEKLLNLPMVALDKRNVVGESTEKLADMGPKTGLHSHENKLQYINRPESNENEVEPQEHLKEEVDPRKEVLVALFNAPERLDESSRRARKPIKRSVAHWWLVDGPLDFDLDEEKTVMHLQKDNEDDEEEEDDYQRFRKAVKEYWVSMKKYYQAAVDAFAKGHQVRAGKLLGKDIQHITEQWNFVPYVVEELAKLEGDGNDSSSMSKEDLRRQAKACKLVYEKELRNLDDNPSKKKKKPKTEEKNGRSRAEYDSDETIEMTEEEIELAYKTVASKISQQ